MSCSELASLSKRYERLEDQLHDLTDLHQHETADLKQELASIEEKVAYQAYERSRDIQVPFLPALGTHRASPSLNSLNKLSAYPSASTSSLPY